MNPAQLSVLIRFHLSEMGARNAHHEFEHLARHLARARIASNILPATGPVSAGGDRGRDFETFGTHHGAPALPGNRFAEHSTASRRLVFQCSLEKRIEAKIRKDFGALAGDEDTHEIVYFCEQNLPIARRLKLADEAREVGFTLQIFDGIAIAEWLAEPDIFWIAQEYLHLPSDIMPASELEEGYVEHRQKWQSRDPIPISRSDFIAIKAGLRKATFDEGARVDLRFWLDKMAVFVAHPTPRSLVRDAMYEIAVANLRGRGDITPVAGLVTNYFNDMAEHVEIGEITNAVVLLTYCFSGYSLGQYRTDLAELFARRDELAGLLEQWLAQPGIGPGRRSGLLRMRGSLELTPAASDTLPDLGRAYSLWNEMLDCAAEAPLYPIEGFSDYLSQLVAYLGERPELLALASRADDLLAERAGGAVAGEKAIDRAFSLLEREEVTAAIRELHKAKVKWFSGERLGGMLRILLLLAQQYSRLGLAYASKYHAMAAAHIAQYEDPNRVGSLLPQSVQEIMDAEYAAGNSLGFVQLFPVFLVAHVQHDTHPLNMSEHPRLRDNMGQLAALLGLLKRANAEARAHVDTLGKDWPREIRHPIWQAAKQRSGFWHKGSWEKVWADLEEAMLDRPFGDLGPTRLVSWTALGIEWRCEFVNDHATTARAEQLIAELQLTACAMAGRDLGVIPWAVTIRLDCTAEVAKLELRVPEKGGCVFSARLPHIDRGPEAARHSVAMFGAILYCCSTLDEADLMARFDQSVIEPIFVGRPYAELHREFVPQDLFAEAVRLSAGPFERDRPFRSSAGARVPWFDGPGLTYNHAESLLDIAHRYKTTLAFLRNTLPRLLADTPVMQRLRPLHDRGFKDWEILSILSNIAVAHLVSHEGDLSIEQLRDRSFALMNMPEPADRVLDPSVFDAEHIEIYSRVYLTAFLAGRRLQAPTCLCPEGIERFLVARYRLREDDIAHDDVFGWSGASPPTGS
ncbi:MAG: hypothetical protein ACRYGG_01025 [Janthinobacterium lividum]